MTLMDAAEGTEYVIQQVETGDEELSAFLFSLGCYSGETITVVSRMKGGRIPCEYAAEAALQPGRC